MSYPVWPASLIRFERPGWSVQSQDARRRRGSDAGPPEFRRRFSSTAKQVRLTVVLSRDEKAVFERFYDDDCARGSGLFWMPDPSTDGWRLLGHTGTRLTTPAGAPLLLAARWLCAWGDEPPVESIAGQIEFRLAFSVWVMP